MITSWGKRKDVGQITLTKLQADPTMVTRTMVAWSPWRAGKPSQRKQAFQVVPLPSRGGANLRDHLLHGAGLWGEGGREEGTLLCASHVRRQRRSSS